MKNLLFTLAGIATFALTACDSNDDDANNVEPSASRTELISSTDWMVVSAMKTESGRTVDLLEALPATAQDDVFSFEKDGEAIREEGATKEVGASDVVDTGTWEMMNQEQSLKVDLKTFPANDQIVEISKEKLVIRNFDGKSETITTFMAE